MFSVVFLSLSRSRLGYLAYPFCLINHKLLLSSDTMSYVILTASSLNNTQWINYFIHYRIFSIPCTSTLDPNILLNTLFTHTLSMCVFPPHWKIWALVSFTKWMNNVYDARVVTSAYFPMETFFSCQSVDHTKTSILSNVKTQLDRASYHNYWIQV